MEKIFNLMISKMVSFFYKDNQYSEVQYWQMYYGLQILSYNVLMAAFILVLAAVAHCFLSSLVTFIEFASFRILADGYHFDSMWKCILGTASIIIGCGKLAQFITFPIFLTIILGITLNIIFLFYAFRQTAANPVGDSCTNTHPRLLKAAAPISAVLAVCLPKFRSDILIAMISAAVFLILVLGKKRRFDFHIQNHIYGNLYFSRLFTWASILPDTGHSAPFFIWIIFWPQSTDATFSVLTR